VAASGVESQGCDTTLQSDRALQTFSRVGEASAASRSQRAGRETGSFDPLKGNDLQKNAATERWLRDLLKDPRATFKRHPSGAYAYRLPNGQGIRFEADGTFDTLLDPPS
jgi:filamentous hemagglutinin